MAEQSFHSKLDSSLQTQIVSMINDVIDELDTSHLNNKSVFDSHETEDINKTTMNSPTFSFDNNNNNVLHYNSSSHDNTYYNNQNSSLCSSSSTDIQLTDYYSKQVLPFQMMNSVNNNNINSYSLGFGFSLEDKIFSEYESDLAREGALTEELFIKYSPYYIRLLKNQHTSRLSQVYLDNTQSHIVHKIFNILLMCFTQLLQGIYSNYFCLKLFFVLTPIDQLLFLKSISLHFVELCTDKISTYPIQCIIEHSHKSFPQQKIIINSIQNNRLMELCIDIYGTHVIEKILTYFDSSLTLYIVNFSLNHFLFLANNSNGVCVVKKIIQIFSLSNNFVFSKTMQFIHDNALLLIRNPFGNHALQSAIDIYDVSHLKYVFDLFKGKMTILSSQKYSSNVIEKCIEKSEEFLIDFIDEIIINDYRSLCFLLKNNYGNYVLQTSLRCCKNEEKKKELLNGIKIIINRITDKKVISKWKNIIQSQVY